MILFISYFFLSEWPFYTDWDFFFKIGNKVTLIPLGIWAELRPLRTQKKKPNPKTGSIARESNHNLMLKDFAMHVDHENTVA